MSISSSRYFLVTHYIIIKIKTQIKQKIILLFRHGRNQLLPGMTPLILSWLS